MIHVRVQKSAWFGPRYFIEGTAPSMEAALEFAVVAIRAIGKPRITVTFREVERSGKSPPP